MPERRRDDGAAGELGGSADGLPVSACLDDHACLRWTVMAFLSRRLWGGGKLHTDRWPAGIVEPCILHILVENNPRLSSVS